MNYYRAKVRNIGDTVDYGEAIVSMMKERYCHPVKFEATYEEEAGNCFFSKPFGDEDELDRQCAMFSRFLFRNFMGRAILLAPSLAQPKKFCNICLILTFHGWPLVTRYDKFHIYKSVTVETADIERLMSVFTLQDSTLSQHSASERVEEMVCYPEGKCSMGDV